jgi:hypothetical protein
MTMDNRVRERMVFETSSVIKRAIRSRAGMEDVSPADVINAALEGYLMPEMAQVQKHLREMKEERNVTGS